MRWTFYTTLAVALLGCGGDDGSSPNPEPASVTIAVSGGTGNMTAAGQTRTLTATVRDANNGVMPNAPVAWTVNPAGVVTLSPATGATTTATAAANGTATVTATSGDADADQQLTVAIDGGGNTGAEVLATASNAFDPETVNIEDEGTVTWTFQATHNVQFSDAGAPANIGNTSSGSVSRTFTTPGTFNYTCGIHPGMNGTVVVAP